MDKEYIKIKKALISVYDKNGLLPFAKFLIQNNVDEPVALSNKDESSVDVTKVSDIVKPIYFRRKSKNITSNYSCGIIIKS